MIGTTRRTCSPSSVVSSRSTPWVAGWCGPMLIVKSSSVLSSSSASGSPPTCGSCSYRSMVMDRSRSRYGMFRGSVVSLIPLRHLPLVEGVDHRLAADREVAAQRVTDVVLGHEDPAQVRVAGEDDAEHVVGLALVEARAGEEVDDRRDLGLVDAHAHLDVQAVDALARDRK